MKPVSHCGKRTEIAGIQEQSFEKKNLFPPKTAK
jgi:hypothetical protein